MEFLENKSKFFKLSQEFVLELGLKGRRALILGASQGMGAEIARVLAEEGCNLIIGARRAARIESFARELNDQHGVEVEPYQIDMSDSGAVSKLCSMVLDEWHIDILLNNTGGPPPSVSTGVPDEVWANSLQSLLMSTIRLSEAAIGGMRERRWGRILTIASSGVIQPIPNLAVSNTVRSAVVGYTKTLSNEVARDGITVNMILPGRIDTDRLASIDKNSVERENIPIEKVRENSWATIPAGRYGSVNEFAQVAVFLMSECAGYVTGSLIRVDGGAIKGI